MVTLCLLLLPLPSFAADWYYTLRPGDSLQSIAEKFCGAAEYGDRISKYNRLDQRIAPVIGSRIRIPVDWLVKRPAPAQVVSVNGVVTHADGTAVVVGDQIRSGQALATADEGRTLIRFADGSTLEIGPEAEVTFDILSAYGDSGMVDTLVRFQRGRGVARVVKQTQGARFRVSTPTGIAAVRGTEFRISSESERSLVETTEGSIGFSNQQEPAAGSAAAAAATAGAQTLLIDAGFGVIATPTGATKEELLPAPINLRGPAQPGSRAVFTWEAIPSARTYEISVYRLAAGVAEPIAGHETKRPRFTLSKLPPGRYRVSVRGVAASGLQGLESLADVELVESERQPWWVLGLIALPLLLL